MAAETSPAVWFEIPARDLERAKAFYEHVLGVELALQEPGEIHMAWFPMTDSGYGAAGALVAGEPFVPAETGTIVYLSTPDIDAALDRAEAKGGRVLLRKTSIGEHGFIGMLIDCEGNRVGLHSMT